MESVLERLHNLLVDPILTLRLRHGQVRASLPDVLVHLQRDEVVEFSFLQPHQMPAWHAFLVQVAFLATEDRDLPEDAAGWLEALRSLTKPWPGDDPWCLVAPHDAPAFMQVPVSDLNEYRRERPTPDSLDIPIMSKNHDVKSLRMRRAAPEDWIYALINLQTFGGYNGRGNYGIIRCSNMYGGRPFVGIFPAGGPGARFSRDLRVLRQRRDFVYARAAGFGTNRMIRLLWLEPWNGGDYDSIPVSDLHPMMIEICRRLRFVVTAGGSLKVVAAGSRDRRIGGNANLRKVNPGDDKVADDGDLRGVTGDPWTPLEEKSKGSEALCVDKGGFTWSLLKDIFMRSPGSRRVLERPLLARTTPDDGLPVEVFAASFSVSKSKAQTYGFHVRRIPVDNRHAIRALCDDEESEERQRLVTLAHTFASHAMIASNECLRLALRKLLQNCRNERMRDRDGNWMRSMIESWLKVFDDMIDRAFFERLWPGLESDESASRALCEWDGYLHKSACKTLDMAIGSVPLMSSGRILAEAESTHSLRASLRKKLPLVSVVDGPGGGGG